ncbi:MAG: SDR family NAD(P)-dependent oxidoreductase [Gammaproteobacteria bacterium]
MRGLNGKVAIVTGATQSMGVAIAARLAEEGAIVIGCGRSADRGEAAAQAIRARGARAEFLRADVGVEADVRSVVEVAARIHGRIDIVVNNAAAIDHIRGGGERPTAEETDEALDRHLRVGLYGPLWFARHALAHMRAHGGAFVHLSSQAAMRAVPGMPAYASAKAALEALSRQMAVDFAAHGIRSNVVRVGAIQVEQNARLHEHPIAGPEMRANQILQRPGRPEDIAAAVAFLASDDAGFMTGTVLDVDGGTGAKMRVPAISATYADMNAAGSAAD